MTFIKSKKKPTEMKGIKLTMCEILFLKYDDACYL